MNQGVFYYRAIAEETEDGGPVFRTVHGYIVKKCNVRIGIYRITEDGLSSYRSVDLRDGLELATGLTIHEAVRFSNPVPTSEMVNDIHLFEDMRIMWNHIMTAPPGKDPVTFPAY